MRLLVVAPQATGHHMSSYAKEVIRDATARGWFVSLLTTNEAISHPAFQALNKEFCLPTHVVPQFRTPRCGISQKSLLADQFYRYLDVKRGYKQARQENEFDAVFAVSLDHFDKAFALLGTPFGRTPVVGMLTRVKFHHRLRSATRPRVRDDLLALLLRRLVRRPYLSAITVVDEIFYRSLPSRSLARSRIHLVPEVGAVRHIEEKESAKRRLGIPADSAVILMYGSISLRKGLKELLDAAAAIATHDVTVLVAGLPDAEAKALLASGFADRLKQMDRLVSRPTYHDVEAEGLVFSAADFVWLGYINRYSGSSGVLRQAIDAHVPILGTSFGLIGETVSENGLGLTFDPDNPEATKQAVLHGLHLPSAEKASIMRALEDRHAALTDQAYGEAICNLLEGTAAGAVGLGGSGVHLSRKSG